MIIWILCGIGTLQFIEQMLVFVTAQTLSGVTFLRPCKKVTKENGIGEALTAKPVEAAFIDSHFSPASSRPPLCTPSGACRKNGCSRISLITTVQEIYNRVSKTKSNQTGPPTGAGWGPGGGRLKGGIIVSVYLGNTERLCGQRLPQTPSLVRFLCGSQEMNTWQAFDRNLQIDKLKFDFPVEE